MTLTEQEIKAIEKEAEKSSRGDFAAQWQIKGYVKGATSERIKAKKLLDAAKELIHLHMCEQEGLLSGKPTVQQWLTAVDNLSESINEYKTHD